MRKSRRIKHEFVKTMPSDLKHGIIYISVEYATAVHLCPCGCGHEIVTPLSPRDWVLIFDGESVTLEPSIGNWSYPCRSHYWIAKDRVVWAERWSDEEVHRNRHAGRKRRTFFNWW